MNDLHYPSKKYVKKGIAAIKKQESLRITVSQKHYPRIRRLISEDIPAGESLDIQQEYKPRWKQMFDFILARRFITVHYYALAAGYRVKSIDEGEIAVIYQPGERGSE